MYISKAERRRQFSGKLNTRDLAYIGMSVALIAVCSWISIPTAIPFTLQTFAVCLIAALFGGKIGIITVGCYILLGALGAPVFSGFSGGFGVLLGTTGGYIIGFLFTAAIVGFAADHFGRKLPMLFLSMAIGILVCYAFGTAWFIVVYTRNKGAVGILTALSWCVIPYIPADTVKLILAGILTNRIHPFLQRI